MGGGIMVGVRKPSGIGKMGSGTSQSFCLLVHHIDEIRFGTAHCLGDLGADLICGLNDRGVPAILHCHRLSQLHADIAAVPVYIPDACFCKGNGISRRSILHSHKKRHNFCCAGRITVLVHSLVIENGSRIGVNKHRRLRNSGRSRRPSLDTVCGYRGRRTEIHRYRLHRRRRDQNTRQSQNSSPP